MEDWFNTLRELEEGEIDYQAYADDQVLVKAGYSVKAIERRWRRCCRWAT